ncbi:MAG: hypothetical protein OHK0039_29590 [Bacteroidia bacterium]
MNHRYRPHWFLCFLLLAAPALLRSADLIRILPVTDEILMLHFDEGHLDYQGYAQDRFGGIKLYYNLLDLAQAAQTASYQISSPDDPFYQTPRTPLALGRKSKGAEFNNLYDTGEPTHLSEHFIYLALPSPLLRGHTYTVVLGSLADNLDTYTFRFDERSLRSETVHVNQAGFTPGSPKYAYLSHWMGDFQLGPHQQSLDLDAYDTVLFHLVDTRTGQVVFSGPIAQRKRKTSPESTSDGEYGPYKNYSRADVWTCDFSAFDTPGTYVVSVDRIGCSFPFDIRTDSYREAYAMASRGLFVQRAGIEKEVEPGWVLARDYHPANGTQTFYYDSTIVTGAHGDIDSFSYTIPVAGIWGWYHDAGDWDHYDHHVRVPATLLHLYDLRPAHFADGDVGNRFRYDPDSAWVEEGQNGVPDLLEEAAWLPHFLRRARHALMAQGLGSGGVPGYVGRDAGFLNLPSWKDTRDVAVTGENPTSTYDYAGLAARYARCLRQWQTLGGAVPQDSIDAWVGEALAAYAWAAQRGGGHPRSQSYAAAAIYLATGDSAYQQVFQSTYEQIGLPNWFGTEMHEFANLLYAVIPSDHPHLDTAFQDQVRQHLTAQLGPQLVDYSAQQRGYRWSAPLPAQIHMLGTFSTPKALWTATAHHFTGEARYLDAVRAGADYLLGGNEMNLCWITGYGEQHEQSTFHLDSWYSRDFDSKVYRNPIVPGLVPYGTIRNCDWMSGCNYNWVGDEDFSRSTAYPAIDQWPASETRFQNRHSIAGSEFTIHQTQADAIFALGYLCGQPQGPADWARPTLDLQLTEGQAVEMSLPLLLTVDASSRTRRVVYYYDWHYLGESSDSDSHFALSRDLRETGLQAGDSVRITAVGYDHRGFSTLPTPAGDATIHLRCDGCTSPIDPAAAAGRTYLYPNPATTDHVRLMLVGHAGATAAIAVFTPDGREVWRQQHRLATAHEQLDLTIDLPAGLYLVQVQIGAARYGTHLIRR